MTRLPPLLSLPLLALLAVVWVVQAAEQDSAWVLARHFSGSTYT